MNLQHVVPSSSVAPRHPPLNASSSSSPPVASRLPFTRQVYLPTLLRDARRLGGGLPQETSTSYPSFYPSNTTLAFKPEAIMTAPLMGMSSMENPFPAGSGIQYRMWLAPSSVGAWPIPVVYFGGIGERGPPSLAQSQWELHDKLLLWARSAYMAPAPFAPSPLRQRRHGDLAPLQFHALLFPARTKILQGPALPLGFNLHEGEHGNDL